MSEEKKYTLEELQKKLTEKERIFCHEYIIDWNKSRAARDAGYSEKTCAVIGYENLTKPYIQQYIEFIKNNIEEEANISKLRVINELSNIAFSSIADFNTDWITRAKYDSLTKEQKSCIQEMQTETRVVAGNDDIGIQIEYVKIKLYDKIRALLEIKKAMGYDEAEKHDHNIKEIKQVFKIGDQEITF